jgi:YidC/Oxa1 family membrane protein insertase
MDLIKDIFTNALLFIYQLLGDNFGLAIIVFTIIVRLATFPFTKKQMDSTKDMQNLQKSKEWQKMQKKYSKKEDKDKLAQEQMKLYQENGINPMGSCLPSLLQFPIIIGLYWSVNNALAATPVQLVSLIKSLTLSDTANLFPLNRVFLWMDLSQPERLNLDFLPFGIPVLAIIVIVSSYFQSKMLTPTNNNPDDPSAAVGKSMALTMPLLMGWLSYAYSAGLALYFVTSNIVSLLQYGVMGKFKKEN